MFCARPTVLIGIAQRPCGNAPQYARGLRVMTAGAPPSAATIERVEQDLGWTITHMYGLTETAPFITINEPRPSSPSCRRRNARRRKRRQVWSCSLPVSCAVVDEQGRDVPRDGATLGEIIARGNVIMAGYYNDPEEPATAMGGGWFPSPTRRWCTPTATWKSATAQDVIISGGENISSVEVEGVLLRTPRYWLSGGGRLPHEKWAKRRTPSSSCVPASRPEKRKSTNFAAPTSPASRRRRRTVFCDRIAEDCDG